MAYISQDMEFTEDKLKAELQRLEAALAERDVAASLATTSDKKQLDEEKHSELSGSPNDTTLEEQELHSIKTELVRVVSLHHWDICFKGNIKSHCLKTVIICTLTGSFVNQIIPHCLHALILDKKYVRNFSSQLVRCCWSPVVFILITAEMVN